MLGRMQHLYTLATTRLLDRLQGPVLLFLRAYFGWQLFTTGRAKLGNIERFAEFLTELGIPFPQANAWFVAYLECVGGLLLAFGVASRIIAFLFTINFVVAYVKADPDALQSVLSDPDAFTGAAPFLFLLVAVVVLAFGPGRISVDEGVHRFLRRRATSSPATAPVATPAM